MSANGFGIGQETVETVDIVFADVFSSLKRGVNESGIANRFGQGLTSTATRLICPLLTSGVTK